MFVSRGCGFESGGPMEKDLAGYEKLLSVTVFQAVAGKRYPLICALRK
jgi:hypothetical protein